MDLLMVYGKNMSDSGVLGGGGGSTPPPPPHLRAPKKVAQTNPPWEKIKKLKFL